MQTHIALLRGINVSGHKKIKMANLKASLEALSLSDVITYIQSGNIIFKSEETSISKLEHRIHEKILDDFGFEVPVLIKTPQELIHALNNNPFEKDISKDQKLLCVVFLKENPQPENIKRLKEVDYSPEEYVLKDKIIYLYAANGFGNAKMSNNFFENKLKVKATTRNWKTTNKLLEIANSI